MIVWRRTPSSARLALDAAEACHALPHDQRSSLRTLRATPDEDVRGYTRHMRYLVRARVKPGREGDLLQAIENQTLGQGSVAEGEYLRNMHDARLCPDQTARWVEVCYCPTPLQEERPYWEEYFDLVRVQDAHDRRKCRDENGTEAWACNGCDCTLKLEKKLAETGAPFLELLRSAGSENKNSGTDRAYADDAEG